MTPPVERPPKPQDDPVEIKLTALIVMESEGRRASERMTMTLQDTGDVPADVRAVTRGFLDAVRRIALKLGGL